jgi:hypothetical protein
MKIFLTNSQQCQKSRSRSNANLWKIRVAYIQLCILPPRPAGSAVRTYSCGQDPTEANSSTRTAVVQQEQCLYTCTARPSIGGTVANSRTLRADAGRRYGLQQCAVCRPPSAVHALLLACSSCVAVHQPATRLVGCCDARPRQHAPTSTPTPRGEAVAHIPPHALGSEPRGQRQRAG